MTENRERQAFLNGITAVLFWSTVATAFELALLDLDPLQLLAVSSAVSALTLWLLVAVSGAGPQIRSQTRRQWALSAGQGFLNPFLYYLVLFKAYDLLPAQEALALNYTWPITLSVLAVPVLGQALSRGALLGIVVSFAGVLVIGTRGDLLGFRISNPLGCGLAVGSSVVWAAFWLSNVRDDRQPLPKLASGFTFGALYCSALVVAGPGWPTEIGRAVGAAVYVGLFEMGLTFLLWLRALSMTRRSAAISQLAYLSPFLSLVFIRLVLGEELRGSSIGGLVLIIGGILIQKATRRDSGSTPAAGSRSSGPSPGEVA